MSSSLTRNIVRYSRGQKDRDCVFGYIRASQKAITENINQLFVPDIVMHLVLSYFHIAMDRWDLTAMGSEMKHSQINGSGLITLRSTKYQTAFLSEVIDYGGIYKWTFKIIDFNNRRAGYNYLIGIWKTKSQKSTTVLSETYFSKDYENMYGWLASCALKSSPDTTTCRQSYGTRIKNNDIVEMILDLETRMDLRFTLNGKDMGKAFDVEQTEYRAAVMLAASNNKIQLLPNQY